jgi:phosphoribosyl-AMP cyclohydrolase
MGNIKSVADTLGIDIFDDDQGQETEASSSSRSESSILRHLDVNHDILDGIQPSTQEMPWALDLQGQVMTYMDLQALGRSLQVCRSWYLCVKKEEYWKRGILYATGTRSLS